MKQTVQEAAKEYMNIQPVQAAIKCGDLEDLESHIKVAFKRGAAWQSQQSPWISIEDKFPEENKAVLFLVNWGKNRYGYFVGVYYGNGCWESDHWVFLPDSNIGKTTHWMPIPENVSFEE